MFYELTIAVITATGFVIEALLNLALPNPVLSISRCEFLSLQLVTSLLLWLSIYLVAQRSSLHRLDSVNASSVKPYKITISLLPIGFVIFGFFYIVSWKLRLSTGRFLSTQDLLFFFQNLSTGLWGHLPTREQRHLTLFSFAYFSLTIGFFWQLRQKLKANYQALPWLSLVRRRLLVLWLLAAASFSVLYVFYTNRNVDESDNNIINTPVGLTSWINPLSSFLSSSVDEIARRWFNNKVEDKIPLETLKLRTHTGLSPAPPMNQRPNIIFIQIESLRHDVIGKSHQGIEVTPTLNNLAKQGILFTHAYSTSTHTNYAQPSVPSSLFPLRSTIPFRYRKTDQWPKHLIWDLLKTQGYSTSVFSSDTESWSGMDEFLKTSSLDYFFDSASSGQLNPVDHRDSGAYQAYRDGKLSTGSLPDHATFRKAQEWMNSQIDHSRPFFLYVVTEYSHFPYIIPEKIEKPFVPNQVPDSSSFFYYPEASKSSVKNAYYNALRATDRLISHLIEDLNSRKQLENTFIVIFGDHGEAFYEHGMVTHGGLPLEPMARTTLLIYGPKNMIRPHHEDYPAQLIDITPTLLAKLGLSPDSNFQGIDVLSSDRPPINKRLLFFHTNSIAYSSAVLWGNRWKLIDDLRNQRTYLFDLKNDPNEERNLIHQNIGVTTLLQSTLTLWSNNQLSFYYYPQYFERYYPPIAPKVPEGGDEFF